MMHNFYQFQFEVPHQGYREDLKFAKTKLGVQKENASFSSPEDQWIKHFAPSVRVEGVNIRANCQTVDHRSPYSRKSVKREHCYCSKESTSQAQPSSLFHNDDGYGGTFVI
jgi:hypothetical protein